MRNLFATARKKSEIHAFIGQRISSSSDISPHGHGAGRLFLLCQGEKARSVKKELRDQILINNRDIAGPGFARGSSLS